TRRESCASTRSLSKRLGLADRAPDNANVLCRRHHPAQCASLLRWTGLSVVKFVIAWNRKRDCCGASACGSWRCCRFNGCRERAGEQRAEPDVCYLSPTLRTSSLYLQPVGFRLPLYSGPT